MDDPTCWKTWSQDSRKGQRERSVWSVARREMPGIDTADTICRIMSAASRRRDQRIPERARVILVECKLRTSKNGTRGEKMCRANEAPVTTPFPDRTRPCHALLTIHRSYLAVLKHFSRRSTRCPHHSVVSRESGRASSANLDAMSIQRFGSHADFQSAAKAGKRCRATKCSVFNRGSAWS